MGALYDDAVTLAKHAGLRPDPQREDNPYNRFIDNAMQPPPPRDPVALWVPPPIQPKPTRPKRRKPKAGDWH